MKLHKKLMLAVFAITVGISTVVSASQDACDECDRAWWAAGGSQNDYATLRYTMCLRRNHCPMPEL